MHSNYTDPVNLGNPEEYTILEFAETILESVGQYVNTNTYVRMCMNSRFSKVPYYNRNTYTEF